MLFIEYRGKHAQRRRQDAVVNRHVFPPGEGRADILADKGFTDDGAIRMRIANAAHVGHNRVKQVVTPGNGLRQRLNNIALRRLAETALHLRHIGHGARHRQRRLF